MNNRLYKYVLYIICIFLYTSCSEDANEEIFTYEDIFSVSNGLIPQDPVKIKGFASFYVNDSWEIDNSRYMVCTHNKGIGNRLLNSIISHEDKFDLSASIIAEGKTFEVLIGKWASLAGTMFGLRKDEEGSFLTTYLVSSSGEQFLTNVIKLDNVSLYSGKKISLKISKRTESASFFQVVVSDDEGHKDIIEKIGLASSPNTYMTNDGKSQFTGYAWGNVCAYMLDGEAMQISDFTFGYPISKDLRLIILGHSYVEGNSIAGQKDERYAYLTCKDIGLDNTLILGQGGQTASSLKELVKVYARWFSNAKYAIINIGGNDFYNNPIGVKIKACVSDCEEIGKILRSHGIEPIWLIDSGYLSNNQDGNDQISCFSNWLLQQNKFVDVRNCFRDSNGNNSKDAYLSDEKHPTVAVHKKIYEEIKSQAYYLFNK